MRRSRREAFIARGMPAGKREAGGGEVASAADGQGGRELSGKPSREALRRRLKKKHLTEKRRRKSKRAARARPQLLRPSVHAAASVSRRRTECGRCGASEASGAVCPRACRSGHTASTTATAQVEAAAATCFDCKAKAAAGRSRQTGLTAS